MNGWGMGSRPREYRESYVQDIPRLLHFWHGKVPVHRVFLALHRSHARLVLGSLLRFQDGVAETDNSDGGWLETAGLCWESSLISSLMEDDFHANPEKTDSCYMRGKC